MRRVSIPFVAVIGVLNVTSVSTVMGYDTRTWQSNGQGSTDWFTAGNYAENAVPTSSDEVIIDPDNLVQDGMMPIIASSNPAHAQKLTIQRNGADVGTLTIQGTSSSLVLGDGTAQTSTIHGVLVIGAHGQGVGSTLKINGDHTVQGAGGEILLVKEAIIGEYVTNSNDKLTIKRSGATPCDDYPDGLSCNVLLHGEGEVKVQFDNRGFVLADYINLIFSTRNKTGTSEGWWIAHENDSLIIQCKITGASHWYLGETNISSSSRIWIDTGGCVSASGPVYFTAGIFSVEGGNFCTSGNIIWKSVGPDQSGFWTEPTFHVASGKTAYFGSGAASPCAACP